MTTTDPLAFLGDELADLRAKHLYRPLRVMSAAQGPITTVDGREVISLSSNDYLGLTHHPRLRNAALKAIEEFGVGSGAVRTIAVDPRERRLEDVQRELGMVEGFDVVLECSGNATALRTALDNMAHGGNMALLGLPTAETPLDLNEIIFNQLTLRGISGREMYETWYKMAVLVQSGLDISPVITHRYAAADFEQAFATAADGAAGKVILDWETI